MPGRGEGKIVLWPHYFDKSVSRGQGRRVALDMAADSPRVHDVAKAARTLGLKVEVVEDAKPPRFWYSGSGCVLVEKAEDPKEAVIRRVARRL